MRALREPCPNRESPFASPSPGAPPRYHASFHLASAGQKPKSGAGRSQDSIMSQFGIGDAVIDRIEESIFTDFKATTFFPDWRPEVVDEHRRWLVPGHYDEKR